MWILPWTRRSPRPAVRPVLTCIGRSMFRLVGAGGDTNYIIQKVNPGSTVRWTYLINQPTRIWLSSVGAYSSKEILQRKRKRYALSALSHKVHLAISHAKTLCQLFKIIPTIFFRVRSYDCRDRLTAEVSNTPGPYRKIILLVYWCAR